MPHKKLQIKQFHRTKIYLFFKRYKKKLFKKNKPVHELPHMLQLYQIERRFNFVGRDIRTLHTTKIMKSSFTHQNGGKNPKRSKKKKRMITMKAGALEWNHRFNRKHVSVLPTARSRWKTLVWLVNKWSFNPPDKPSFSAAGSPVTTPRLNALFSCGCGSAQSQVCIPRKSTDPLTFASKTSKYFTNSRLYFLLFLMDLIQTWS